ncbi:nuclear pore membrane glycoprotein 210-like [Centruroides sculpturatus]|uniref:nuclear pore membrane glycoprotein 210-like n=1 Tax=Centruroides sculpturatus TaxID=218467 RepID=UPI000C6E9FA4|nr:nuclear pore membrane glycoprotein 210-like [Centruroides sculpturatus]
MWRKPGKRHVDSPSERGDTFSSLSGIEFEWTFSGPNNSSLQFLNFVDSSYNYGLSSFYWEKLNSRGSLVLTRGREIGIGKIFVRPKNPIYADIKTEEREIVIKSNIRFKKEILYLLPGSKCKLVAEIVREGKHFDVTALPDDYVLKVRNSSVIEVTNKFDVTAKLNGKSVVRFARKNVKESKRLYSALSIYVVEPSYMTLHILPENNWALHEMNVYIITVKLFDIYHHQISLSDNVYTYVQFPSKSFHVNYSSPNGTYHVVQATVAGSGFINAYLVGVKNENGEKVKFQPEIRTSQQYIIYQSLQIFPSVLLLPWESSIEINHTVSFKVLGGSGFYKWSSTDTDIGSISYSSGKKSNIATVVIRKIGEINITVADAQNEFLHNMAKISVQPIADLEIMPTILETQVNNDVIVPVSLYGYEDEAKTKFKVFDECSKIPLNVEVVDKARFTYVKGE